MIGHLLDFAIRGIEAFYPVVENAINSLVGILKGSNVAETDIGMVTQNLFGVRSEIEIAFKSFTELLLENKMEPQLILQQLFSTKQFILDLVQTKFKWVEDQVEGGLSFIGVYVPSLVKEKLKNEADRVYKELKMSMDSSFFPLTKAIEDKISVTEKAANMSRDPTYMHSLTENRSMPSRIVTTKTEARLFGPEDLSVIKDHLHVAVIGRTNSGKTTTIQAMMAYPNDDRTGFWDYDMLVLLIHETKQIKDYSMAGSNYFDKTKKERAIYTFALSELNTTCMSFLKANPDKKKLVIIEDAQASMQGTLAYANLNSFLLAAKNNNTQVICVLHRIRGGPNANSIKQNFSYFIIKNASEEDFNSLLTRKKSDVSDNIYRMHLVVPGSNGLIYDSINGNFYKITGELINDETSKA